MKTIGDRLPAFKLPAVGPDTRPDSIPELSSEELKGRWTVLFFWPKDFTFVCPTEIIAFDEIYDEFTDRDAVVLGASTDSDAVHIAWRRSREDLGKVRYPWLSDLKRDLATDLGVLNREAGVANRATFIIDPDGVIRYVSVNDLDVGRNPAEVLRVLDALQTDELCPCNWQPGQETLVVS